LLRWDKAPNNSGWLSVSEYTAAAQLKAPTTTTLCWQFVNGPNQLGEEQFV